MNIINRRALSDEDRNEIENRVVALYADTTEAGCHASQGKAAPDGQHRLCSLSRNRRESGCGVADSVQFEASQDESRSVWARITRPSRGHRPSRTRILALVIAGALGAYSPSFAQSPGENFGYRAIPIWGSIPVLTILWQFSDTEPFPSDYRSTYAQRMFGSTGPLRPSLAGELGFFDQVSNGSFNFTNAGIIGPINARDIAGTPADESRLTGFNAAYADHFMHASRAAEAAGVNFRRFDRNGDGVISRDELVINIIHSDRRAHEFMATTHSGWIPPSAPAGTTVFNELGYAFNKLLGYVYRADFTVSPITTRPLRLWFNAATGDNYSTGLGSGGIPTGYGLVETLGRMFNAAAPAPPNTVAVYIWRNDRRKDFLLTTASATSAEAPRQRPAPATCLNGVMAGTSRCDLTSFPNDERYSSRK